jgi:hypothetical protein
MAGYRAVCIVGIMAINGTFPKPLRHHAVWVMHVRVSLHILVYQLVRPCQLVGGPWALLSAPRQFARGVRTPSTMCDSYSIHGRKKGMVSTGWIHIPILLPSCAHLFILFLRFRSSKFSPPIATMASHFPRSRLCTKANLL